MKNWVAGLLLALAVAIAAPAWAVDQVQFVTHTFQSAAAATGNGTALAVDRYSTLGMQVMISDTATVTFEATSDGTNWVSAVCVSVASTSGTLITSTTASVVVQCPIAGLQQFRARISDFTGGTVTVTGRASTAVLGKKGGGGSGGSLNVAEEDGNPSVDSVTVLTVPNGLLTDDGSGAVSLASPATPTLDNAFDQGKLIDGANSEANCFRVGTAANYYCIYSDAGSGLFIKPEPLADTYINCWTNLNCVLYDREAGAAIETVDPDAASTLAMWTYGTAYRPKKSILLTADAFYMKSGCTLTTDAALITAGLTEPYITCTDNDASGFHRTLAMPDNWDGGTVTFKVFLTNVNAAPANDYRLDLSAECEANSEVIGTSISGTGEVNALFDFDNTGTCTTACAQFDLAAVTTAAHTVNGTCAGGNLFRINALVDATTTTTAQVADVKIIAVRMEYSETSRSQ
jgi:hypothetical protein